MGDSPRQSRALIVMLFLAAAAVTPYAQTLRHQFVEYDDDQYIYENATVQQGLTLATLKWAFTTSRASNWHPLTWLSHMTDVQVWNLWAGGHHLTNVIIHALNTLILFWVVRLMTGAMWRSALVAALFAVHPLHVESVAWVAERKDVLSTFFGLLAMWGYVWYVRSASLGRYALVGCLFGLSLMSKPMLVTLPCVLLLLDVWPLRRVQIANLGSGISTLQPQISPTPASTLQRLILEKLPLLAMSAASGVITVVVQHSSGAMAPLDLLPLPRRLANAIVAYAVYLGKTVWPVKLAAIYPLPMEQSGLAVTFAATVLLTISAVVFAQRRNRPYLTIGWLWYLGTLIPVIGLMQVGEQSMADRYTYLPLIGLFIMLAWSLPDGGGVNRAAAPAITAGVLLALAGLMSSAVVQASYWKDTLTLFQHAIAVTDENFVAESILGDEFRRLGQKAQAIDHLTKSLQIRPNYATAYNNMAMLLADQGDFAKAEEQLKLSLRYRPEDPTIWNSLGVVQFNQGRLDEAMTNYHHALKLDPNQADALANVGAVLLSQGKPAEAIAACNAALRQRSDLTTAHAWLGAALWELGRTDEAIMHYSKALERNPDLINTRVNLGVALAQQNKIDEATAQFEYVLRLNPQHPEARRMLDTLRQQRGE